MKVSNKLGALMAGFLGVSGVFVSNAFLGTAEASSFYVPDPCRVFEEAKKETSNILNHSKYTEMKVANVLECVEKSFKEAQDTVDQVNNLSKWFVLDKGARRKIEAAQSGLNEIKALIQAMKEELQKFIKPLKDEKNRIGALLDQMSQEEGKADSNLGELGEETEEEEKLFREWNNIFNKINNISISELQKDGNDFITSGMKSIIQKVDQIIALFQKA